MNQTQALGAALQFLTTEIVSPLMRTERHNEVPLLGRRESTAEHSFHVASVALHFVDLFPKLDALEVAKMALQHDYAEASIGDVSVYASAAERAAKATSEHLAASSLHKRAAMLNVDLDPLVNYLAQESDESRYVSAIDKIVPYYLVLAGVGHHARPTLEEYDQTRERARDKIRKSFAALLPAFEAVSDEVRARVVELNS